MSALRTLGRCWPLPFLLCLAACGAGSVCKQIARSDKTVASWAATAAMVGQRWAAGDVPTSYARNTLAKGARQMRSEAAALARSAGGDPLVETTSTRYVQLAAVLTRMEALAGTGNKAEVAQLAAALPTLERLDHRCSARGQAQAS